MWPVILWWLLLEGLGLLAFPLTFALFGRTTAYGYPFAKVLALLLVTYASWLAGFAVALPLAVHGTLAVFLLAGVAAGWWQRNGLAAWITQGGWRVMLRHDLLWTIGFLFFVWQRMLSPDIFGAEKYMDFAFLNMLARTNTLPPPDPWMSGLTINYYYFGYLMFANLVRVAAQPSYVTYNLCIATIGGLAFAQTCAVVLAVTRRWGIALLGGAMSTMLGNLDGFLQFVEKGTVRGMDYWRSSRVVARGDTINEFPFFSTIHGDLHPHFMVLPVSIMLLGILLDERLFPSRADEQPVGPWRALIPWAVVTFVLGAMVAISIWELPIGALLLFLLAGRWQPFWPLASKARLQLVLRMIAALVGGYMLFLPFYMGFAAPPSGVGWKVAQSSLAQFLTVFGLLLFPPALLIATRAWALTPKGGEMRHLAVAASALAILFAALAGNAVLPLLAVFLAATLVVAYQGAEGEERAGYLLVTAALTALLACEIVFLRDSYGERLYRMNTVFKLYFQAWTILAVAAPWCVHRLMTQRWRWSLMPKAVIATLAVLIAAAVCYPLGVTLDRMGRRVWNLDGNAYMKAEHPDDFAALTWLRNNVREPEVILEATGNPYSYFARFSSNTGLPTVLGWANHEGLWRAHDRRVNARRDDVTRIYNASSLAAVETLLDRYDVRYVIVGDLERQHHQPGLAKFAGLEEAFRSGQTVIYRR